MDAPLAQLVEHRTFNPWVVGSSPTGRTNNPASGFCRGGIFVARTAWRVREDAAARPRIRQPWRSAHGKVLKCQRMSETLGVCPVKSLD